MSTSELSRQTKQQYKLHPMTILNYLLLFILFILTLYPFWYVAVIAFDAGVLGSSYQLSLWPQRFTLENLKHVFITPDILRIYGNTIYVVAIGTMLSIITSIMLAYGLTQKLIGIRVVRGIILFTMLFSGGMIPTYLVVSGIGLINNLWSLILPAMVSPFNVFILISALKTIPSSMEESAQLDGAGVLTILFRILLPLCLPTIATITLFYAVAYWNNYFTAMLYMKERDGWTLQVLLRQILMHDRNTVGDASGDNVSLLSTGRIMATVLATIMPIMVVYPFVQKYFTKGVMVGAIKE